ncbi:MAG TPA: isoprenylcysteine carboxylmethyltransferase family protein [Terriglobales bacterium]|nr:isoprenylcysteine carboxylmethyltransferase family protein [Terriglobales bacterium]
MNWHHLTLWQIELIPWYVFVAVWIVASFWVKTTKAAEPVMSRLAYGSLMALGFYLLFSQWLAAGVLGTRFIRDTQWVAILGIVLTFAGAAVSVWARIILGENWSAKVTRKVDHELIRSGPYALVRHPIYSGLLLATIGTAIFIGQWRGLIAVPLVLLSESIKARREEQFMIEEFGQTYRDYREQTWFIVPGF